MAYRRSYRSYSPPRARWMDLRFAGKCSRCSKTLAVGARAFYDPSDRSVTCWDMACCNASGLTRQEWIGSPVSGGYATVRSDVRLKSHNPGEAA